MSSEEIEEVTYIDIEDIDMDNEFNCRSHLSPTDVVQLSQSIEENGLLQPVVVCPQVSNGKKYKLLAGFRRTYAHRVLKRTRIKALIRSEDMSVQDQIILNLTENMQRSQLNILEESNAIKPLFDSGMTEAQVMKRLNVSRGWIQMRHHVLKLPEEIYPEIENGTLNQSNIRDLAKIYNNTNNDKLEVFKAVRELKDAKLKGKKTAQVNVAKVIKNQKKQRSKQEINQMQDRIYHMLGNGLSTRLLAWCGGEISDDEMETTLKEYCSQRGKKYITFEEAEDLV